MFSQKYCAAQLFSTLIIIKVSLAPNQHIKIMKTEVMTDENSALSSQELITYYIITIKTVIIIHNINVLTVFLVK